MAQVFALHSSGCPKVCVGCSKPFPVRNGRREAQVGLELRQAERGLQAPPGSRPGVRAPGQARLRRLRVAEELRELLAEGVASGLVADVLGQVLGRADAGYRPDLGDRARPAPTPAPGRRA